MVDCIINSHLSITLSPTLDREGVYLCVYKPRFKLLGFLLIYHVNWLKNIFLNNTNKFLHDKIQF